MLICALQQKKLNKHIWPAGTFTWSNVALFEKRLDTPPIQWKPLNTSTSGPADLDVITGFPKTAA